MRVSVEKIGDEFDITLNSIAPTEFDSTLRSISQLAYPETAPPVKKANALEGESRQVLTQFVVDMKNHLDKIWMIKAIRSLSGSGLKEAKDFVEAVQVAHGITFKPFTAQY